MALLVSDTQHCQWCGDTLPIYFAVIVPPQHVCTLCRALGRSTLPRKAGVVQHEVVPLPPVEPESRQEVIARIVAWATAHGNFWPSVYEFGEDEGLPSLQAVQRLWGGSSNMRAALHQKYPHFRAHRRATWTVGRIHEAFRAWIARYPGNIPLTKDLETDMTLPGTSIVSTHCHGLWVLYAHLDEGKYLAQFQELNTARQRAAGKAAYAALKALREAQGRQHKKSVHP